MRHLFKVNVLVSRGKGRLVSRTYLYRIIETTDEGYIVKNDHSTNKVYFTDINKPILVKSTPYHIKYAMWVSENEYYASSGAKPHRNVLKHYILKEIHKYQESLSQLEYNLKFNQFKN